jgi:hypothetical protein
VLTWFVRGFSHWRKRNIDSNGPYWDGIYRFRCLTLLFMPWRTASLSNRFLDQIPKFSSMHLQGDESCYGTLKVDDLGICITKKGSPIMHSHWDVFSTLVRSVFRKKSIFVRKFYFIEFSRMLSRFIAWAWRIRPCWWVRLPLLHHGVEGTWNFVFVHFQTFLIQITSTNSIFRSGILF